MLRPFVLSDDRNDCFPPKVGRKITPLGFPIADMSAYWHDDVQKA